MRSEDLTSNDLLCIIFAQGDAKLQADIIRDKKTLKSILFKLELKKQNAMHVRRETPILRPLTNKNEVSLVDT